MNRPSRERIEEIRFIWKDAPMSNDVYEAEIAKQHIPELLAAFDAQAEMIRVALEGLTRLKKSNAWDHGCPFAKCHWRSRSLEHDYCPGHKGLLRAFETLVRLDALERGANLPETPDNSDPVETEPAALQNKREKW